VRYNHKTEGQYQYPPAERRRIALEIPRPTLYPFHVRLLFFFFQSRVGGCQLPSHKPKRIFPALWVLMLSSRLKSARITTHPQKPSFASDAKLLKKMEIAQACFACKASAIWLNAALRALCGP
jgi:hypothetical protein